MLLLCVSLVGPVSAEESLPSDPYRELEILSRQLDAERIRKLTLESKAHKLSTKISNLRDEIIRLAVTIQSQEKAISDVESRLIVLDGSYQASQRALAKNNRNLSAAIGGLARFRRTPPEAFAFTSSHKTELQLRVAVLTLFLTALRKDAEQVSLALSTTRALSEKHTRQHLVLIKTRESLKEKRIQLKWMLYRKSSLQALVQSDRANAAQEVALLASKALNLGELVTALKSDVADGVKNKPPVTNWRAGAHATPPQDDSHVPVSTPTQSSLPYPTWGPIVHGFGEELDNGAHSQGIFVQALVGAYVIAPREGQIVFSGDFRTYGRLLIIEHAGGYHTLLGGFAQIHSGIGDWVEVGEPVGVMSDRGRQDAVLYIEVRRNGEPVSPREWLESIDRKVSG